MPLILPRRLVFLHLPKTGGNWVERVLTENRLVKRRTGGKHSDRTSITESLDRARTFCFVRHPTSWYRSWFRYMRGREWRDWTWTGSDPHPCVELNGLGDEDINLFIYRVLDRCPGFLGRLYDRYVPGSHYVGCQENLARDLEAILKLEGHSPVLDLEPVNRSRGPARLSPDLERELLRTEVRALEVWERAQGPVTDSYASLRTPDRAATK
jgi:hypothetical protein